MTERQASGNIVVVSPAGGSCSQWQGGRLRLFLSWPPAAGEEAIPRVLRLLEGEVTQLVFLDQPVRSFLARLLELPWPFGFSALGGLIRGGPLAAWYGWWGLKAKESFFLPARWLEEESPAGHARLLRRIDPGAKASGPAHPQPSPLALRRWAEAVGCTLEEGELGPEPGTLLWETDRKLRYEESGEERAWNADELHRLWEPRDLWPLFAGGLRAAQVSGLVIRRPAFRDRLHHGLDQ